MSSQEQTNHPSAAKYSPGMNPNHRATPSAHTPQNGGPIEPTLPLYWSVLHHRNVNDGASSNTALQNQNGTEPHAAHGNTPEVIHERQPFISEGSTQSALTGYDSTTGSPRVSPLTLPQKQLSSGSENAKRSKWGRVREAVDSKELFIKYLAEEGNTTGKSKKWSDLANITHELSLRECFMLFLVLLAVGAVAYSYVFEQWHILDSLYFTTVLLTTVGYGDLTPTTSSGKMFASVFALGGIVLLGLALGVIGSALVEAEINYTEKVKSKATNTLERAFTRRSHRGRGGAQTIENIEALERDRSFPRTYSTDSLDSIGSESTCSSVYGPDSPTRSVSSKRGHRSFSEKERKLCCPGFAVVQRHLPGFAPLLIGGLIMGLIEHWYWDDAIYYCVVTATTVGFGDFHPNTDTAKLCAILFIPIVVAATGYILGNLASFIIEQRRAKYDQRLWSSELKIEDIDALDEARDGGVSELEYIKFMLVAMKKIDPGLFDELRDQFEKLDPTGDGKITKKDLSIMATRRLRKVSHKLKLREYKKRLTGRHHGSIRESGFVQAVMAR